MSEQKSEWHRCPNCNSITVSFDPPLEFEVTPGCNDKYEGYFCDLEKDHEGDHMQFLDVTCTWPGQPDKNEVQGNGLIGC